MRSTSLMITSKRPWRITVASLTDQDSECILEHTYTGRPPTAHALISSILTRPSPRPAVLQLTDLAPSTTAYSVTQANLLFVAVCIKDAQPLAILDFLHRLIDVFEDFLGSPLLVGKIQDNYEVVAQLLGEMCDGGVVCNTEPNALKETVEVSSLIGKLFTQVGLPGYVLSPTWLWNYTDQTAHLRL